MTTEQKWNQLPPNERVRMGYDYWYDSNGPADNEDKADEQAHYVRSLEDVSWSTLDYDEKEYFKKKIGESWVREVEDVKCEQCGGVYGVDSASRICDKCNKKYEDMVADEYEPSGEPDIMSEDDQLLLDYFNNIEGKEAKEPYGVRDEYEALKNVDTTGMSEEEIDGYYERLNELRITLGESKANETHYDTADSWWNSISNSDKTHVLNSYISNGLTGMEDGLDWTELSPETQEELSDYFGEKIFTDSDNESYAGETDIFTWISQTLGLKPRKQTIYGPQEIPDNRPKEKPTLCSPSETYDHKSGKCIPKYMAPWKLRNEGYNKITDNFQCDFCNKIFDNNYDYVKHVGYHNLMSVEGELVDKILGDSMLPGADWLTKKITGEEDFKICPECGYHAGDLKSHYKTDHGYSDHDAGNLIKGNEEIIEKIPPKIEYLYYKQYALGRRANVKSHYGKEVSISTLREAENWWGQVRVKQGYPVWSEMNIINKQRAITDYLRTTLYTDEVNITNYTWDDMGVSSRRDLLMDAGIFPEMVFDEHGSMNASVQEYEKLTNANWDGLPDHIRSKLSGESYAKENDDIKLGDVVKFKDPLADGIDESNVRMVVLEDNGDRILVEPLGHEFDEMAFVPTSMMAKSHFVKESKQSEYNRVRNLMDMRETPEHGDDLDRWASEWGVSEELVEEVWEKEFGGKFEEDYANEGGRGSGKRGHSGWMKSLEEASDYKECPHCKVMSDHYGGKCNLCGKKGLKENKANEMWEPYNDDVSDWLDNKEDELVEEMTSGSNMSEASARNQIYWGSKIDEIRKDLGYTNSGDRENDPFYVSDDEIKDVMRNWGAQL